MILFVHAAGTTHWLVEPEMAGRFVRMVARPAALFNRALDPVYSAAQAGFKPAHIHIGPHGFEAGIVRCATQSGASLVVKFSVADGELLLYNPPFTNEPIEVGPVADSPEFWLTAVAVGEVVNVFGG